MSADPRDVNVRVGLDPSAYIAGGNQVSLTTKRMLAQQEAADRKWRAMQSAHQAALNEEAAREASVADAAAAAEKKKQDAIKATNKSLAIGGAALLGLAVVAERATSEYNAKMAQVQSLTRASAADMAKLKAVSMTFAKDFGVSASQAADAEIELVKAGVSVADITGGALKGALTLASAGQLFDVADATSIAASAMTQFGLKGKDVGHVADLLAAGADKALGSVGDLGEGLKYVGPVAASMGVSLDQTVGVLAELAQNGILADQAGTSVRGMLLSLSKPSKQASEVMDEYGISVFDAQGKFIGLNGAAGQLHHKLSKLTQAQQAAALGTLFGNKQVTAATILMKDGAQGVDDWTQAVNDQGFAAEQASGKLGSLSGDAEKLKASLTNDLIELGQGGTGPLRDVTKALTGITNAFGDLPDPIKQTTLLIAGGGGLALLAVAAINKIVGVVKTARTNLSALGRTGQAAGVEVEEGAAGATAALEAEGAAGETAGTRIFAGSERASGGLKAMTVKTALLVGALDGVASGLEKFQDWGTRTSESSADVTKELIGLANGTESVQDAFKGLQSADLGKSVKNIQDASSVLEKPSVGQNWNNFLSSLTSFGKTTGAARQSAQQMFAAIDAGLTELVQGGHADQAKKAFDALGLPLKAQLELLPKYHDAMQGVANDQALAAQSATKAAGATKVVSQAQSDATKAYKAAKDSVEKWAQTVAGNSDAFIDFSKKADDAKLSLDGWIKQLQDQEKAENDWADNLKTAAQRGVSKGVLAELAKLGPQGALRVKQLADGSKKQIDRTNKAFASGQQAASDLESELEDIKSPAPVSVRVDTALAEQNLKTIQTLLAGLTGVHIGVTAPSLLPTHKATGGKVTGSGTGTSDSIPAMLSNGEFVVNAKATRSTLPLLTAINSGSIPGFAKGGLVDGHSLEFWQSKYMSKLDYLQQQQKVRDDKKALAEKEEYGKKPQKSRDVLRGLDRRVAQAQLAQDEQDERYAAIARKVNASKKGTIAQQIAARDKAKAKSDAAAQKKKDDATAAAAKKSALAQSKATLNTEASRGEITSDVTSGLSGAQSAVDEVTTESQDTNLTAKQRSTLAAVAKKAEPALTKLYAQSDAISKKLDAAQTTADNLDQIKSSTSSSLSGGFSLADSLNRVAHTDAYGNTYYTQPTGKDLLSGAQGYATKVKTFATKMSQVAKKLGPTSGAILQEIVGMGVDQGTVALDAILSMSAGDQKSLVNAYASIQTYSDQAGQAVTEGFAKGGASAADAFVTQLTANQSKVNAQIAAWGTTLTNAMLAPYGEKLDKNGKIVKKALGGAVAGPGTGTSDSIPALLSNGEHVWTAAEVRAAGGQNVVARMRAAALAGRLKYAAGSDLDLGNRAPAYLAPVQQSMPASAQTVRVELPRELVVVDSDGALVGRMRVEAGRAVIAHTAAQDAQSAYVEELTMPTSPDGILTATFVPVSNYVQLTTGGATWSTVVKVMVTRAVAGASTVPVRGIESRTVVGGVLVSSDNEAPQEVDVTYAATGYDASGAVVGTSTVTVSTTGAAWGLWVKAPGRADLNVLVTLDSAGDMGRTSLGGSYTVPGGKRFSESAGLAPLTTSIEVATRTPAEYAALGDVISQAPGQVLLLQTGQPEELPSGYYWCSAWTPANPTGLRSDLQAYRTHTLQLEQVAMPAGGSAGFAGTSHDVIAATFATHQEIADAELSHLQLAQGQF